MGNSRCSCAQQRASPHLHRILASLTPSRGALAISVTAQCAPERRANSAPTPRLHISLHSKLHVTRNSAELLQLPFLSVTFIHLVDPFKASAGSIAVTLFAHLPAHLVNICRLPACMLLERAICIAPHRFR